MSGVTDPGESVAGDILDAPGPRNLCICGSIKVNYVFAQAGTAGCEIVLAFPLYLAEVVTLSPSQPKKTAIFVCS